MKKLLLITIFALAPLQAFAAITSITAPTTGASGYTLATGSGANRAVVCWTEHAAGGGSVAPSLSGGGSFTQTGGTATWGASADGKLWYMVSVPGTGNQTVTYTQDAAPCMVLDGVDQVTPVNDSNHASAQPTGSLNVTLTISKAGTWAVAGDDNTSGAVTKTGILTRQTFDLMADSNGTIGTGSQIGGFTFGGGGNGGMAMAAFNPSTAIPFNFSQFWDF